jgi:aurora kinase, other
VVQQVRRPHSGSPAVGVPGDGNADSRVLTMPSHCPRALQRRVWSIEQFKLEKVLYVGSISRVLRAVDYSTGMTVALKVYKRHKLSDMEKCAPSPHIVGSSHVSAPSAGSPSL